MIVWCSCSLRAENRDVLPKTELAEPCHVRMFHHVFTMFHRFPHSYACLASTLLCLLSVSGNSFMLSLYFT